jgi:hypothetical protein
VIIEIAAGAGIMKLLGISYEKKDRQAAAFGHFWV